MARSKKQVSKPQVNRKEVPRRDVLPGSETSNERICWRFKHADHEGPWALPFTDPTKFRWILDCLTRFETMTLNEIFHSGGYPGVDYDIENIPNQDALERLEALGLGDMTKIWRLRLGGEPRLYGFLIGHTFHIVWWDPHHQIWPSTLKHT